MVRAFRPSSVQPKQWNEHLNTRQSRATPYIELQKQYGNEGIFALLASYLSVEVMKVSVRYKLVAQALDLLRPDLHHGRLQAYSIVLNKAYLGETISDDDIRTLRRWAKVDPHAERLEAYRTDETELISRYAQYPVEGMYVSEEERAACLDGDPLDRERFLTRRL